MAGGQDLNLHPLWTKKHTELPSDILTGTEITVYFKAVQQFISKEQKYITVSAACYPVTLVFSVTGLHSCHL